MKKTELKRILHSMIDSLDDKHMLYDLRKNIFPYVIKFRTKKMDKADDNLTKKQIRKLDEVIGNPGAREIITVEEFKKGFTRWLPGKTKQSAKEEKLIVESSKKKLRKKLHTFIDKVDKKYLLNVLLDDVMPDALNGANAINA